MWIALAFAVACSRPEAPPPSAGPEEAHPAVVAAPTPAPEPQPVDPTEPEYAAREIRVAWAGALGAPPGVTRTKEEARENALDLRERALGGADFEALAREASDAPTGARGGALGTWHTGALEPGIERAVAAVPVGGIAPLAETPWGWSVLRREPVYSPHVTQILVSWKGAWRSAATRSQAEARAKADAALAALDAGQPVAAVVADFADDPTRADLGVLAPGQAIPAVDAAVAALAPGAHSGVIATRYGFHVLVRADDSAP